MLTNESRPTATVIPFPVARRRPATAFGLVPNGGAAPDAWPTIECGSGWYHEAAIRDAERPRRP